MRPRRLPQGWKAAGVFAAVEGVKGAFEGVSRAGEIFGVEQEQATMSQKISAGIGGFVEGRMSATATASFASGGMTSSVSYQMELGDELNNSSVDKDYVSANFSYAF